MNLNYPWHTINKAAVSFFTANKNLRAAARAWLHFTMCRPWLAHVTYGWLPQDDFGRREQALGRVTEDLSIALRGYSTNTLTGPLLDMWSSLKTEKEAKSLCAELQAAVLQTEQDLKSAGYTFRYEEEYRNKPVLWRPTDFAGIPVVWPSDGSTYYDRLLDMTPETEQESMRQVAAYIEERRRNAGLPLVSGQPAEEPQPEQQPRRGRWIRRGAPRKEEVTVKHLRLLPSKPHEE